MASMSMNKVSRTFQRISVCVRREDERSRDLNLLGFQVSFQLEILSN